MANPKMLINGLKNQRQNIDELIQQLSERTHLSQKDCALYDQTTKRVEQNLRTLRKLMEGLLN